MTPTRYVGRFAPTPTGPLHFGSLVAAVGSFLDARHHHGRWLVRIDDLDAPRVVAGSADAILHTLEACGLHWDGPVVHQSESARRPLYESALQTLIDGHAVFACSCSRSELGPATPGQETRYPGICRGGPAHPTRTLAWRLRVEPSHDDDFIDRFQGPVRADTAGTVGDFVVWRRDGLPAYQLAVVVDDQTQGVTDVVRGADLLDNVARQRRVGSALGAGALRYGHLPVATDAGGRKLGKSTGAPAIDLSNVAKTLWQVLDFLEQKPPKELLGAPPDELWAYAMVHWSTDAFAGRRQRMAFSGHCVMDGLVSDGST